MDKKPIKKVSELLTTLKSPLQVVNNAAIGQNLINKFVQMYQVPYAEAVRFYEREKDNFSKMISQSEALRNCTPMSIYLAFGKVMALKLTFDNGRNPLIYLIPGKRNIGTKTNKQWIEEVVAQPSPEGEKEVRIMHGILKKVDQPIIVHEGDDYREYLHKDTGQLTVEWGRTEKSTNRITGSFIRIVEPDGTVVFKTFKLTDIHRWKTASETKNAKWDDEAQQKVKGKANALYTSGIDGQIDEGFLKGKTLLHSFKGYKQVDFAYSAPEGFVPDNEAAKGLNENFMNELEDAEIIDADQVETKPDEFQAAAQEEKPKPAGVTVVPENDDPFN